MSRAFKRESDSEELTDPIVEPREVLPVGFKNYITPQGAGRFLEVLRSLAEERRQLLAAGEKSRETETKQQLRALDQRIRYLKKRRDTFDVIEPSQEPVHRVIFGTTVTVRDAAGREQIYQICGVDEADPKQGRISWISPIARALLSREVGDEARLRLPRGETVLEIIGIHW